MPCERAIEDVRLETVPKDAAPTLAESFNLSWREQDSSGSWGFHCKSLSPAVGLNLMGKPWYDPDVLQVVRGTSETIQQENKP